MRVFRKETQRERKYLLHGFGFGFVSVGNPVENGGLQAIFACYCSLLKWPALSHSRALTVGQTMAVHSTPGGRSLFLLTLFIL